MESLEYKCSIELLDRRKSNSGAYSMRTLLGEREDLIYIVDFEELVAHNCTKYGNHKQEQGLPGNH